jgi:hypothetical protein
VIAGKKTKIQQTVSLVDSATNVAQKELVMLSLSTQALVIRASWVELSGSWSRIKGWDFVQTRFGEEVKNALHKASAKQ